MKKKNAFLQKKVSLKKVALTHLNFEEQSNVRGARLRDTKCDGCDSYDPSCISKPRPTVGCV
ncbi:hypothetical protein HHL17_00125 [Chitinophaga sp. G-6-1-13]|uniref:Uncharacterized protein n=1 Tax=Chitinophaga fulva TaxID=2728842 RepID=A0A848GFT7_9BACT|nr:class I lanthipeptide [Chitinophaga fulva]NML35590.1 hypothetical protein [Chitinophaga fulva]